MSVVKVFDCVWMLHYFLCPLDGDSYQLHFKSQMLLRSCAAGYLKNEKKKEAWRSLKDTANPEQNPIDVMIMEEKQ